MDHRKYHINSEEIFIIRSIELVRDQLKPFMQKWSTQIIDLSEAYEDGLEAYRDPITQCISTAPCMLHWKKNKPIKASLVTRLFNWNKNQLMQEITCKGLLVDLNVLVAVLLKQDPQRINIADDDQWLKIIHELLELPRKDFVHYQTRSLLALDSITALTPTDLTVLEEKLNAIPSQRPSM